MQELKCPSCGGQMQLSERTPGDKIATCPYCQAVVDLPDEQVKERIRESSEEIVEEGRTIRRTTRTIERSAPGSVEEPMAAGFGQLNPALQSVLKGVMGGDVLKTPGHISHVQQTFTHSSNTSSVNVSSSGNVQNLNSIFSHAGSAQQGVTAPPPTPAPQRAPWKVIAAGMVVLVVFMLVVALGLALSIFL